MPVLIASEDAYEGDHVSWPEHIEVELTFLPTEHGGRQMPVTSGYRPQFDYGGDAWDAVHQYIDVDEVKPGESAKARLSFLSPQSHVGRVFEGMPFLIREGNRVVGYGRVTRLLELREVVRAMEGRDG
jgi:translation elongation factor EF-Tu-like GTPase